MALTSKEKNTRKLIEYLGNPSNDWHDRKTLAIQVLGYKHEPSLYKCFTPAELDQIEREALDIRRSKYCSMIAKVDKALLLRAAMEGDPTAAKLCYQRFENWKETTKNENSGVLKMIHISNVDEALIDEDNE